MLIAHFSCYFSSEAMPPRQKKKKHEEVKSKPARKWEYNVPARTRTGPVKTSSSIDLGKYFAYAGGAPDVGEQVSYAGEKLIGQHTICLVDHKTLQFECEGSGPLWLEFLSQDPRKVDPKTGKEVTKKKKETLKRPVTPSPAGHGSVVAPPSAYTRPKMPGPDFDVGRIMKAMDDARAESARLRQEQANNNPKSS